MAIIEPYEYKGEAIEMTMTGKELSQLINNNPDVEYVVSFDFKTALDKRENVRKRVILYGLDS